MFNIPILFLIYNRPETETKIFQQIKKIKPSKLYIAADGSRVNKTDDYLKCQEARRIIDDGVDWKCEIHKLYRKENLGCKNAPSSAIDWFFKNEEMGIILEDDCLPDISFFSFCKYFLNKYKEDERIMMISGSNFAGTWKSDIQDYHFSNMGGSWGWATWKRAWKYYDVAMKSFANTEIKERLKEVFKDKNFYKQRMKIFNQVFNNKIDAWDYQWNFARLTQSGLTIVPSKNLVTNIGYGESATHTVTKDKKVNLKHYSLSYPFKMNDYIMPDKEYDKVFFESESANIIKRISSKLISLCKANY